MAILINGANVTRALEKDSFPDHIEQSFKGPGRFDFEVRSISFKLIQSRIQFTLQREMPVLIKTATTGKILLDGFIDELKDEGSPTPEITVFPSALLLKDTQIGTEKNLKDTSWNPGDPVTDEDEIVREFHSNGAEPLAPLVQKILNDVNGQKGANFRILPNSVPPKTTPQVRKFFGNVLDRQDRASWWWKLLGPIASLIAWLTEDDYQIRFKNGTYYLIKRDFGLFQKLWIVAGGLLNVSAKVSISRGWLFRSKRLGIYVPSSSISLFDWGRWTIPGNDWKLLNVGVQFTIYRMVAGGLEVVREDSMSVFPQPDFSPTSEDMTNQYGAIINPQSTENISTGAIRAYLDEEGYQADTAEILARFDLDDANSYAIVQAKKKRNDISGETLVLSFETPFDDAYELHYRDKSASEILRDLCIVSNRFWFVDGENVLWMLPRGTTLGDISISRRYVLEKSSRRLKQSDDKIPLNRYEEDDRGAVVSWGIKLRKNEADAIMNFYKSESARDRVETTLKIYHPGFENRLNKALSIEQSYLGSIIEEKQGLGEPVSEMVVEG
ncbi:MAG: hypothetical protein K9N22_04800 [Candidatus Marinimicrobia bacterium]|nr:hypothetical protein [Candidatus Neomarinimicrobiota bacterium]